MPRLVLLLLSAATLLGCSKAEPLYCANGLNAHGNPCGDDGIDGGGQACTKPSDCPNSSAPVCDTKLPGGGICVMCTIDSHDFCTGMTPRCDADVCVACVDDSDCGAAGDCLPDGSCAAADHIIHAISMGGSNSGSTCGAAGAGNACDLETALSIAQAARNVIKLDDPGPYKSASNNFTINSDIAFGVVVDARGATLHRNNNGPLITLNTGKGVTIFGGIIEQATGNSGDGIQCLANSKLILNGTTLRMNDESGIDATNCTITITGADISMNSHATGSSKFAGIQASDGVLTILQSHISTNRGGGITLSGNGTFTIIDNAFLNNGDPGGVAGGVLISSSTSGNRLDFNTLSGNNTANGVAPGIQCSVVGLVAQNNIVWNNGSPTTVQVGGACTHDYSDIGPVAIPAGLGGDHNLPFATSDPMFNMTDLSVKAGSPVRGKANPQSDLTGIAAKDINGKPRVAPADIGAYVVPAM